MGLSSRSSSAIIHRLTFIHEFSRIQAAKAIDDTTLLVEFTNQEVKTYDIRPLLDIQMFSPLRQPAFFKNFEVDSGGYAIVWNDEIDISEYELWQNGAPVASQNLTSDKKILNHPPRPS